MLVPKIAFRNLFRQKRRSLLTILTMAGGFALFSISVGLADGTYADVIEKFTHERVGHVQIHKAGYLERPTLYNTMTDLDTLATQIEAIPSVEAWSARVYSPALAFAGAKTTGVRLVGIDPAREAQTTTLKRRVREGRYLSDGAPETPEVLLGKGIAKLLDVDVGDEIVLLAQAADGSLANDLFRVVGILVDSGSIGDRAVYTSLPTAQEFLVLEGRVHEIAIVSGHYWYARRTAKQIAKALARPDLDVHPWQEIEKDFYTAMRADMRGMWISLLVIMFVVAIGVLNTVLMTILERTREFGVLRALGTRPGTVFGMILLETTFLAIVSVLIGLILGWLGNYLLIVHGIPVPPVEWGGMLFERMIGSLAFRSFWLPTVATFVTAVLVSLWPAARAARVSPVRSMRAM